MAKKLKQKSLTLNDLVKYNQEILFPALNDKFAKNKEETENIFSKIMDGQDKILKIVEDLKSDNIAGSEERRRQEEKLENYEIRIKIVEKKMAISA